LYNINDNNNALPYQEVSIGVTKVILSNGFYTGDQLRSHMETVLQSDISGAFSVTYSAITGKYTFTDSTSFRFNDEDSTGCLDVIGFTSGGDYGTTQTSAQPANLTPYEDIYIQIDEDKARTIQRRAFKFYTFLIPIPVTDFGAVVRYRRGQDEAQQMKLNMERYLTIKFYDKNAKLIQFNEKDWKLVLKKK
jgi:hypothetical protein